MEFTQIAATFGVPAAILAFFAYAMWRASIYMSKRVVEPVVASHLALMQSLQDGVPELRARLDELSDSHQHLATAIHDNTTSIKMALKEQTDSLLKVYADAGRIPKTV